jgi:hypothetical protein
MKLTKKQEHAITIAGIGILAAIFFYQIAYGANDKAYMAGYNAGNRAGHDDWSSYDAGQLKLHPCPQSNESGSCPISYPSGHTPDWYAGYKTGYNHAISEDAAG